MNEKTTGKTRISILIDDDVISYYKQKAINENQFYQPLINKALRNSMSDEKPLTESVLRNILSEFCKKD